MSYFAYDQHHTAGVGATDVRAAVTTCSFLGDRVAPRNVTGTSSNEG